MMLVLNSRRGRPLLLLIGLLLAALVLPVRSAATGSSFSPQQQRTLQRYAAATWQSFVALADPHSGLPADNLNADTGARSAYTSPTNIASYLWSTLAARDLELISPHEARARIRQTLATLSRMERHAGQLYNWYDPHSAAKLTVWPPSGTPLEPFLSSVDNGWLAAALIMVGNDLPQLRAQAHAILAEMDFSFYYDPGAGLLRGGYWPAGTTQCNVNGFTCHHYGALNTEPRIASYIGIAMGDLPATHYFKMWRTFPATCDWGWHEMQPGGVWRTYLDVPVFEGHYRYRGMRIVPSWGGSMFEALMPALLVPEAAWGPRSWGLNHPLYVRAQIEHGLDEAGYGFWGFSPANNPAGGYREYGVDAIGLRPDGYSSNNDHTLVDDGFGACRPAQPEPAPEDYTNGVVTPHAAFLALEFAPDAALKNLRRLEQHFEVYGALGFYDSVNVSNGQVSRFYLALDQGMIMAALGNALTGQQLQQYFTSGPVERAIKPLLSMEEFTAGE